MQAITPKCIGVSRWRCCSLKFIREFLGARERKQSTFSPPWRGVRGSDSQVTLDSQCLRISTRQVVQDSQCLRIATRQVTQNSQYLRIATRQVTQNSQCLPIATRQVTQDSQCLLIATCHRQVLIGSLKINYILSNTDSFPSVVFLWLQELR